MIKFGQGRKTAQNKHFPYHYLMMSKIVIYILCVCFDRSLQNVTFRFSSSVRASLLTFCQGRSSGHQWGLHSSLPQPGLLLPVEYFSISGIKFLSWAQKNTSQTVYKFFNAKDAHDVPHFQITFLDGLFLLFFHLNMSMPKIHSTLLGYLWS